MIVFLSCSEMLSLGGRPRMAVSSEERSAARPAFMARPSLILEILEKQRKKDFRRDGILERPGKLPPLVNRLVFRAKPSFRIIARGCSAKFAWTIQNYNR